MALSQITKTLAAALMFGCAAVGQAQNPCATVDHRALILSGGGIKGAFETGAAYHLIVQRGCDFHDFSGVSVGALIAAVLAQAQPSANPAESHAMLALRAEALVDLWESFKGARDVVRNRKFAAVRFVRGAEAMHDLSRLRNVVHANVSLDDLAAGRPLRIGVTSFWDGTYREITTQRTDKLFMDYLYASAILPVMGVMPRMADERDEPDSRREIQVADGSLRHVTPVASYFKACAMSRGCSGNQDGAAAHASLQQLFVIGTSPYARGSDNFPVVERECCPAKSHLVTKGPQVMGRAVALIADTPYRSDLEAMFTANDLLTWRAQNPSTGAAFPIDSFNRDVIGGASLPYTIALISPLKETADISDLLNFSPKLIREQLLAGCLAADSMMTSQFALEAMDAGCEARFGPGKREAVVVAKK